MSCVSIAEVAESADAQDLKSCEPQIRTGSSPVFGIKGSKAIASEYSNDTNQKQNLGH